MIRIGLISYTHNDPLFYFFEKKGTRTVEIIRDKPKALAGYLLRGELDIAQISLARLAGHNFTVVPATAVHCQGPSLSSIVASNSRERFVQNTVIGISSETETSSLILKWILTRKGIAHQTVESGSGSAESLLASHDYALLIGDEALKAKIAGINVIFDIGDEWYQSTGKPCIFAVSAIRKNREVTHEVVQGIHLLREAALYASDNLSTIASDSSRQRGLRATDLAEYFSALRLDFEETAEASIRFELSQILEGDYEADFLSLGIVDDAAR